MRQPDQRIGKDLLFWFERSRNHPKKRQQKRRLIQFAFVRELALRLAPGRTWRWLAWGSMPAIATCRRYGLPAYLEGEAIWLHGRRVARLSATRVGECAVIEGSFPPPLAAEPSLEAAFRERIEAQHGWQFDTAWPTGPGPRAW